MLEKINSKRFEKEIISSNDQHHLRGGAQTYMTQQSTNVCVTTLAVWEDCGTVTEEHQDVVYPVTKK